MDRARHVAMGQMMAGAIVNTVMNEGGGNKSDVMEISRFAIVNIVRTLYASNQEAAEATMKQFCELMLEAKLK